ncbi:MAG TPA: acyl-CoA dehydrogenase family protein [Acidimicrobiales bacterium]|nr:acyl-CoA dehydrogenase family protein [Acidimicrobiales bacterium]
MSSDIHDVLAPHGSGGTSTGAPALVAAARRVADAVLAPAAAATDRADVVPRSHLDALAGAGLCGLFCPPGAPPADSRRIFEILAGACGVTFFVWVQHHAPVRMLADSANASLRERHLDDLCAGRTLGGVAFAYLRRPGPPAVVATPVAGGYRIDGEAPWVTSWGLARLYAVAARCDDQVVFFAVLADDRGPAGVRASPRQALAAMNASSTVRLAFDGLVVPAEDVISTVPFGRWQAQDRVATAQPNPAAFGIAETCVRLLGERAPEAAEDLGGEVEACRRRSYDLADMDRTDDAHLRMLVEARAWSLELGVRAATALVTSVGGRAMSADHPAQRLLREAAFFTIQAQTAALRQATLGQLTLRR